MSQGLFSANYKGVRLLPFADISSDFEASKVVILPVPYDGTVEWRSGTREGPQAIIDASQYLELYDLELQREIYQVGIHTLPEIKPLSREPLEVIKQVYEVAKDLLAKGKLPVMLGGEHSLTLGMVKAFRERFEHLSVLQLDAMPTSVMNTKEQNIAMPASCVAL